jgi:diguanylate cyclase (GGDEF)-like protein
MDKEISALKDQLNELKEKYAVIAEAFADLQKRFFDIDTLYTITTSLSAVSDFDNLGERTREIVRNYLKVDYFTLLIFDHEAHPEVTIKKHFGPNGEEPRVEDTLRNKVFKQAIQNHKIVYVKDTSRHSNHVPLDFGFGNEPASVLCLPLISETSTVLGLLNLCRQGKAAFASEEVKFCSKIADQIARALNKILLYEHTKQLSITDELTEVFNRRYFSQQFEREIQRAKRYHHSIAIIMLDIDHFKAYNDRHGHTLGDHALKTVARKLENILRKADIIARYGGDEFIIMLPEISNEQARKVANKLRKEIEKPSSANGADRVAPDVTISLGVAVYPQDTSDPYQLVEFADTALYTAKSRGRNRVAWYEVESPAGKKASKTRSLLVW